MVEAFYATIPFFFSVNVSMYINELNFKSIQFSSLSYIFSVLGSSLEDYMDWNKNTNNYRCLLCQREYASKQKVKRHIDEVHFPCARAQCYLCMKWFKSELRLKDHIRVVHKRGMQ